MVFVCYASEITVAALVHSLAGAVVSFYGEVLNVDVQHLILIVQAEVPKIPLFFRPLAPDAKIGKIWGSGLFNSKLRTGISIILKFFVEASLRKWGNDTNCVFILRRTRRTGIPRSLRVGSNCRVYWRNWNWRLPWHDKHPAEVWFKITLPIILSLTINPPKITRK